MKESGKGIVPQTMDFKSADELNSGGNIFYSFFTKYYYTNDGYVMDVTSSNHDFKSLRKGLYVDFETRFVAIEFLTYFPDGDLLSFTRIMGEFTSTGEVMLTFENNMFDEWWYLRALNGENFSGKMEALVLIVCEVVLYIMAITYVFEEFVEMVVFKKHVSV